VARYLVDAVELGHNPKGISRVLASLVPRLVERSSDETLIACTVEGDDYLIGVPPDRLIHVARPLQSAWEQWGLPKVARRVRADAVYSHRESGAAWGPPLVLHVPEDPEVRWERNPPRSAREYARRIYSRATMKRAMGRAVVAASTGAVADRLSLRYRVPREAIAIIPLGVDPTVFAPAENPAASSVFHLGSSDPRDQTLTVVEAWAKARRSIEELPKLVIGGMLGDLTPRVERAATHLDVEVVLTGPLSDAELAAHLQHAAVVVQPSADEGFGLQPLEAMACGAPVVVTMADAVLEVVDDAAVVCEPTTVSLAEGIVTAITQAAELRLVARTRARAFTWEATADAVLSSLNAAQHQRR
jgi:glycosyltransferase involved in cell wall biosynthesis